MKTIVDDPEGFFEQGGWSFLDPESEVSSHIVTNLPACCVCVCLTSAVVVTASRFFREAEQRKTRSLKWRTRPSTRRQTKKRRRRKTAMKTTAQRQRTLVS